MRVSATWSSICLCLACLGSGVSYVGGQEEALYREGVKILQEYLQIDTTNPPGNEMEAAQFLKKILDREGIPNRILDLGHQRANFYAVLKGDGSSKGLILLHHMDVVPAEAKYWKVPPFAGQIVDGEIYGRGAIDIKGKGIIDLMTLIRLKREHFPLRRDLIFLGVADEEMNSIGTRWMIEKAPELLQGAEFVIDEGASARIDSTGQTIAYFFSVGEKSPLWLTITFRGEPGHGSEPLTHSSVNRAIRAAGKLVAYQAKFQVLPGVRAELKQRLGQQDLSRLPGFARDWETSLGNEQFLEAIAADPSINALLRNTIAITCLQGSNKINTIPNEAKIGLDCRLLPGSDRDAFMQNLLQIMGDDTATVQIEEYIPTHHSPGDTAFVKALEKCTTQMEPGVKVIPVLLTSSTDSSYYRSMGIQAYGFEPYRIRDDENLGHCNDERISVDNIRLGIILLTNIIKEMNQ